MTRHREHQSPDWIGNSSYSGPDWAGVIPRQIWDLGEVFFPIPPGQKAWEYPHHMDEYRYSPDSKKLNAYLEAGWNYGIACADDLVVIDIDEPAFLDDITTQLPPTVWQRTGSHEGYHLFYSVAGIENKSQLTVIEDGEKVTIGDLKANHHGYVVGAGSRHPSGNLYGPLRGESITEVTDMELLDALDRFIRDKSQEEDIDSTIHNWEHDTDTEVHSLYELTADDVLPWLEAENRVAHPVHGSETGMNFMKNEDGDLFTCWRCQYGAGPGCGLNAAQFLAVEHTGENCEDVRARWNTDSTLHYAAWQEALRNALINGQDIPYRVIHGYAVTEGIIQQNETLSGEAYFEAMNCMWWEYIAAPEITSNE